MRTRSLIITLLVAALLLTLSVTPSLAFDVNRTGSGAELKWPSKQAAYLISETNGPAGSATAIIAGMNTWNAAGSSFNFIYAGSHSGAPYGEYDGQNICDFGPLSSGTIAMNTIWYNSTTGEILDADIRFNTNYGWTIGGSASTFDVQNIATHELGHTLSLADLYSAADTEKTMYGYGSYGETGARTLHSDDIAGIRYLYPSDNPPADDPPADDPPADDPPADDPPADDPPADDPPADDPPPPAESGLFWWGTYNAVCCGNSRLSFVGAIDNDRKSSISYGCSYLPSWDGVAETTTGTKTLRYRIRGCGYNISGSWTPGVEFGSDWIVIFTLEWTGSGFTISAYRVDEGAIRDYKGNLETLKQKSKFLDSTLIVPGE